MKLPSLPFFHKQEAKEYYLALLFQDEQIQAVIFEAVNGMLRIVNSNTQVLTMPLEQLPFEKLLTALDKTISNAESILPHGIQTHKTIFGVKQSWVEEGQIKKDYLLTLKKACEELDLQPIGFLVFPEAVAHLLQKDEGAPVSGIFIEIGATTINATLLRAGRIVDARQGPISENHIAKSVDNLLAYFVDVEILPSRIIIADDGKHERLSQQFIHHQWSKQLPFLHVPQITPLPESFAIRAVLYGTATQMGFKVTEPSRSRIGNTAKQQEDIPAIIAPEPKEETHGEAQEELPASQPPFEQMPEETAPEKEEETLPPLEGKKVATEDADEFGFVHDGDVAENIEHPTAFSSHVKDNAFGENEDELAQETFANIPEDVKEKEEGFGTPGGSFAASGAMGVSGMKHVFAQLKKQIKSRDLSLENVLALGKALPSLFAPVQTLRTGPKLIFLIPVVLLFLFGGILWYIFGLSATVTLSMNTTPIDGSAAVTVTTKGPTDLSQNTLGGTAVSVDESDSTTIDATGTKNTGNKATGTVTLYNNSDHSQTFSAGTTITSSNGLKFALDKDTTVASASGDIFSGTKPGTQDIAVTASTFGTDYNLPSGTTFSVSGGSSVAGKNANALSGGTKTSVTVVSAQDVSNATDQLIQKVQDKAKQDMQKQNGTDKTILPIFTSTTLSQKSTDRNVGDEAKSVTLTATVTFESIAYTSADLKQLATGLLQNKITSDMTTTSQGIQATLQDAKANKDGSTAQATLKASAKLLPKLDTAKIAQELAGKSFGSIQTTLSYVKQLQSADVTLSPNLFFLPHVLPRLASHIRVQIAE